MTRNKNDKKSKKIPEQSTSSKINHYKGVTKTLRKRIDNLEKRMVMMEQKIEKLTPKKSKCIKPKEEKNTETARERILRQLKDSNED